MRIFLLHYYLNRPNPAYSQIADALRSHGHDVWIGGANEIYDLVWHDGKVECGICRGPAYRTGRNSREPKLLQEMRFVRCLQQFIKAHTPDVVQVNPASLPLVGALPLGMPNSIRFVVDWRQVAIPSAAGKLAKLRQHAKHTLRVFYSRHMYDRATFLHEAGAQVFLGDQWSRWATVVPLGVGAQFQMEEQPGDDRNGDDQDTSARTTFLYIGSLSRIRKLDLLIEAAAQLQDMADKFELQLVGPDNADGYYQKRVQQLQAEAFVRILPPVPYTEIPAVVRDADVALAYVPYEPADWQYHPTLKVLEYRALGVPMIATNVAPNRDEIEPNRNGLLVDNEAGQWANAMQRFIEDPGFQADAWASAQLMRRSKSWTEVATAYATDVYMSTDSSVVQISNARSH